MNTELRKRLEEAAKKSYKERYPDGIDLYKDAQIDGFIAGGEHGYKEALAQAKKWMQNYFPDELDGKGFEFVSRDEILAEFESDMNKLWAEKK